jgi:hypothetical protein
MRSCYFSTLFPCWLPVLSPSLPLISATHTRRNTRILYSCFTSLQTPPRVEVIVRIFSAFFLPTEGKRAQDLKAELYKIQLEKNVISILHQTIVDNINTKRDLKFLLPY